MHLRTFGGVILIYLSYDLEARVNPEAESPHNVGVYLGELSDQRMTKNTVFLPRIGTNITRINRGLAPELDIDVMKDGRPYICHRDSDNLYLILSSKLQSGDGRGKMYALKKQPRDYLVLAKCTERRRHWAEILVQAQPRDAFYITWKCDGELLANQLIYVDNQMTVHAMRQEQAHLQFEAMGIKAPFRMDIRDGRNRARIIRSEWCAIG